LFLCGALASGALASGKGERQVSTQVYMLTGLLGITSGLDGLAAQVADGGLPVRSSAPGGWPTFAKDAIAKYRSGRIHGIVIVGYSAGGGAAIDMARDLNAAKVPVNLLVVIDGVGRSAIPPNVRKAVNYYVAGGISSAMRRKNGALKNIPVRGANVGHFTVIATKQAELLRDVMQAGRAPAVRTAKPQRPPASATADSSAATIRKQ
jgi:pimeloyl-ACP methyl ester carboxylesterase